MVWHYLCDFISGVPFDSEKDLGKDLWDVHTVVPGKRDKGDNYHVLHSNVLISCFYMYILHTRLKQNCVSTQHVKFG